MFSFIFQFFEPLCVSRSKYLYVLVYEIINVIFLFGYFSTLFIQVINIIHYIKIWVNLNTAKILQIYYILLHLVQHVKRIAKDKRRNFSKHFISIKTSFTFIMPPIFSLYRNLQYNGGIKNCTQRNEITILLL